MAKIKLEGLDEYIGKLNELSVNVEGAIKRAVYPAAGMVIEEIKRECPTDTGDLRDSMSLIRYENKDGFVYTQVNFDGYDSKGVPNAVKANVLESGSSRQPKRPFIRPAVKRVQRAAEFMIATEFEKIIDEKMNS